MNFLGVSGETEREQREEHLFKEIVAKRFSNLGREMDIQIHEAQRTLNKIKLNKSTLRHTIKFSKVKNKENFESRKRKVTHHREENPSKIIRFLSRNLAG